VFSSSEAGSSFECKLDDGEFAACTSPDARTFADGPHTFSVRAKDAAGNVDQTPATKAFTVDTTAPETTIDSGVTGTTRDTTPQFTFSSSESGATFECRVNGGAYATCSSPRELGPLADGPYTFEVRSTDTTGHTDATPASRTFTVDTTAPETTLEAGGPPFRFTSSEANSTFECKLDASEYAACTSPRDLQGLTEGTHVFMVRATDPLGNTDQSPATATFTIDTTPPETTIDAGPSPFRFSSSESGSTFQCRLDGSPFAACTSPRDLGTLGEGSHTFEVQATDAAGNTDPTPASQTFTVDRTGPTVTSVAGPNNRSNDKTPTFTFAAESGATFECKLSSADLPGAFAPCTSPKEYGPLDQDARYTFTVRATDATHNVGPDATWSYTLFTTAPQTGITQGPPALSNDPNPVFILASSPPGATFTCRINAGDLAPCPSTLRLGPLEDGIYTLEAFATDDAGNVDPSPVVQTFTVDTTAPDTFLDSAPTSPVHSGPLAFGVRAGDGDVACSLDDGDYGSCASLILADTLAVGNHVFRARAEDDAGNVDRTPVEFPFTVVNAAPTAALVLDRASGAGPLTVVPTPFGGDDDGDRLTYQLDFGDGQTATGTLPVALAGHRYDAPGVYTIKLTVSDGRATASDAKQVTVTTPLGDTSPLPPPPLDAPLSLSLSASTLSLGTFIPGVARDYTTSLTATTAGNGTLTVSDAGANAPGHLVGLTGALAQPLQVKATNGAFAPLTGAVTIPTTVEFKQSIAADEVLKPGAYSKALTFTLTVTTP
jgi:hypothetical protein